MSNGNEGLQKAMRALWAETHGACAAHWVKSKLLSEMRRRRRKALVLRWWPGVALAALAVVVVSVLPKSAPPVATRVPVAATDVVSAPVQAAPVVETEPPGAPLPVARRAKWAAPKTAHQLSPLTPWYILPGLPQARQGHMVYMEVGSETARLFGLTATGPLQAEVYLGDDGVARAIRLVRTTQIARGE